MTQRDDSRKSRKMKRDMDLIRSLLLLIEEQGNDPNRWIDPVVEEQGNDPNRWIDPVVVEGYTEQQIDHHGWLLADGGYISAIDLSTASGSCYRPRCLTSRGHDLLADIRERDVWETTVALAKRGGVASIPALAEIAKALVQKKLERLLDLES
jgi:hypothetical protein